MTSNRTNKISKREVSNAIINGIKSVVSRRSTPWVGTMTELNHLLTRRVNEKVLPGSPSALRVAINTVVRRLRNAGVKVRFTRSTDHSRTRLVEISNMHIA